YDQAVDRLEMAVEQMPDNASALNNLGVALIRLGQYGESRQYLMRLVNRNPDVAAPYFNVAITFVMEKDFQNAMDWIRKGASRCTPAQCQRFLADTDFESIRGTPEFMEVVDSLYPDLPAGPRG
ncbi:MAG TPA: tetratricopeptide repeat protein, partial [Kiritimatiellia bacterium]